MGKENLQNAKKNKNDEFYTLYETIEKELNYYTNKFKDKIILCNCDDPELFKEFHGSVKWKNMLEEAINKKDDNLLKEANQYFRSKNINDYEEKASQFWLYFHKNFTTLGIKELIATHYNKENKTTYGMRYKGGNDVDIYDFEPIWFKESNGDFRSEECVELLKHSDIVVTNPPFSLFIEYINQLIEYKKEYLVIGNLNAITYKNVFKFILDKKIWLGKTLPKKHKIPDNTEFDYKKMERDNKGNLLQKFGNHCWYTNLNYNNRLNEFIPLNYLYYGNESYYPKYVNYDAINVNKITEIPKDYNGSIGVPISYLLKWNPDQFDILALGITGSIEFDKYIKMEILKNNIPTNKYTINSSGKLALKYVEKENPKEITYRDVETNEIYEALYARLIIKRK